jgi:hypothetical protein
MGLRTCGVEMVESTFTARTRQPASLTIQSLDEDTLNAVVVQFEETWQRVSGMVDELVELGRSEKKFANWIKKAVADRICDDLVASPLGRNMRSESNSHARLILSDRLLKGMPGGGTWKAGNIWSRLHPIVTSIRRVRGLFVTNVVQQRSTTGSGADAETGASIFVESCSAEQIAGIQEIFQLACQRATVVDVLPEGKSSSPNLTAKKSKTIKRDMAAKVADHINDQLLLVSW